MVQFNFVDEIELNSNKDKGEQRSKHGGCCVLCLLFCFSKFEKSLVSGSMVRRTWFRMRTPFGNLSVRHTNLLRRRVGPRRAQNTKI